MSNPWDADEVVAPAPATPAPAQPSASAGDANIPAAPAGTTAGSQPVEITIEKGVSPNAREVDQDVAAADARATPWAQDDVVQPASKPAAPLSGDDAVRASSDYSRLHAQDAALEASQDARSLKLPVVGNLDRLTAAAMPLPLGDEVAGVAGALRAGVGDLMGGHDDVHAAYLAGKDAYQEASDAYRSAHPVSATLATLAGAIPSGGAVPEAVAAPTLAAKLTALASEAPTAEPGLVPLLQRYATGIGKGALAGAGYGAAYGAADGTGADRVSGAARGAASGALMGGAAHAVLGPAAQLAAYAGEHIVSPAARTVVRGLNAMSGGALLDPEQQAAARMAESLSKDLRSSGPAPGQVQADWRASGASEPSYLDVTGENSRALQRTAAAQPGPARNMAVRRTDQVTSDLQPNMIGRTAELVPGAPHASDAQQAIELQRATQANAEYTAARKDPIHLSNAGESALGDDPGVKAISYALRNSVANRDEETTTELRQLLAAGSQKPPEEMIVGGSPMKVADMTPAMRQALGVDASAAAPGPVSAGAIDAVRQAFHEMGEQAAARGDNYAARGYHLRAADLDNDLSEQSPRYEDAKNNYAAHSERLDAIKLGGGVLNLSARPDEFTSQVAALKPDALQAARIGGRSALMDAMGDRASNSTGLLNELATGTNLARNLEALFGPEEASRYRAAAGFENAKLQNARFVSPNTGSQTAPRAADAAAHGGFPTSVAPHNIAATLLKRAFGEGRTMTEPEREAIVRMGQGDYAATLAKLADQIRLPKQAPAFPLGALMAHAGLELQKTLSASEK